MNYEEAIDFINSFTKSGGKVRDLSRAENLMEKLGNPQNQLKFVHIAGTNGKGSVLELMSQSLINAGYKTGQFTSPFINCYEDRIRINSENISHEDVAYFAEKTKNAVCDEQYSQFEITMAVAMQYFAEKKCDIVFLEAGIGGIFDSTNIIEDPLVSVVTSISLDHTAILGDTVEKIAMQKAGIIKRSRPAVLSWNNSQVFNIFQKETILKDSELIVPSSKDFLNQESGAEGCSFDYKGKHFDIRMHGRHQIINAATAIKALEVLRKENFEISDENIQKAFSEVQVPSRMEIIKGNPDIIIDGGHNPAGVSAMLSTLMSMGVENPVFVFGMVDTKDTETAASLISTFAKAVICVDGFAPNSVDRSKLAEFFTCEKYASDVSDAFVLAKMKAKALGSTTIVVCGSLYLTGKIRNMIIK